MKTLIIVLSIFLWSSALLHANDEDMIQSIMKLRADVESLYTQIDEKKESYKAQMKSLALQIADSEAQINRLNTSIKLVDLDLQKLQIKIENTSTENVELKPLLKNAIRMLKTSVREGMPFKVDERLAVFEKIETELKENLITEEKALALVWASYEDNIRLTSEIGLFKQNIRLDDQNVSAQVAKIGTMMLYFSTPDDRVGYAVKDGSTYTYKTIHDKKEKKMILAMFDALNKQIRTGYFKLPNALLWSGDNI